MRGLGRCLVFAAGCALSAAVFHESRAFAAPASPDGQIEIELMNQLLDRELADTQPAPVAAIAPMPASLPALASEPVDMGWSLESPNMPIGSAHVFYKTSRLDQAQATQRIRFRIENPNMERAAIAFNVELVSEHGEHYRNVIGAIVDPGHDLTGPELDLLPFEPGDPIAFVRILHPMVCAEPPVALPETGRHQDDCLPVHPALSASN